MADYQLTSDPNTVIRNAGGSIPNDPANADWQVYQQWLADGGVPDPAPPAPPPQLQPQNATLFDHENRIRVLEGAPTISLEEFVVRFDGS